MTYIGGRGIRTRYRAVEASSLIGSNQPFNAFEPHPEYPAGVQGRVYHGDAGRGARERVEQMAGTMQPDKVTHPSVTEHGSPIITGRGHVVVGNQRAMAQQLAYGTGRGEPIRASTLRRAEMLGLDPSEIRGMQEPVVVREIVDPSLPPDDHAALAQLNQASDVAGGKAKDPRVEAAGRARQLARDPSVLEHFAQTIEPEEGLADYLRSPRGPELLNRMVKAEVIQPQELDAYREAATGRLTPQGRDKLAEIIQSSALGGDVRTLADAPPAVLQKLEQAWPKAVRAGTVDGWSTEAALKDALALHARRVDTPGARTIADVLDQADMFGRENGGSQAVTLARFLETAKKGDVTAAFAKYADAAEGATKAASQGADMFGATPETAEDAFARIFGGQKGAMASSHRAGAVGAQPERAAVRVPGSLADREDPYNVAAVKMMTSLAGGPGGGYAGAVAGGTVGNTPEERRRNRMLGAGLGAVAGATAPFAPEFAERVLTKARELRAITEALPEVAAGAVRFDLRPSPSLIRLRIEGQPARPQVEALLDAVRANPKAAIRYSWRDAEGQPIATGNDLVSLFSDLQSNRGARRAGAVGSQPDLFGGPNAHATPAQGSMFGESAGTAGSRSLAETERAATEELARLNAYGERIPAKLAARKAELQKLVNRDKAITPAEIQTRARAGEDLFGNRTGAIGAQPGERPTRRVRGLSRGVEEKAVVNKLGTLGDLPEYETMDMAEQATKAVALVGSDYATARKIALGTARAPEGLLPEAVFTAVENHAIQRGDVATLRAIATGKLTQEATEMGRRIRVLAERNPESPVAAMQDVIAARTAGVKDAAKATAAEVSGIRQHLEKATRLTSDAWHRFVDSMRC